MTTESQLLDLLHSYISSSQYSLVQYAFMANYKHEEIRKALISGSDRNTLQNKTLDLDRYLEAGFSEVCSQTFEFLKKYFSKEFCSKRSKDSVRVSIKVIARDKILTLERFPKCLYEEFESDALENSAFKELTDNDSTEYFCNSIPKAIADGKYKNNRIDLEKAEKYIRNILKLKAEGKEVTQDSPDIEWAKCWKNIKTLSGEEEKPTPESCYKSTIVLPIYLNPDKIAHYEFKDFYQLIENDLVQEGKFIFGYLCLDHYLENYFQEDDVKIADLFAKILSIYMLFQLSYTQCSPTYYKAFQEIIEEL